MENPQTTNERVEIYKEYMPEEGEKKRLESGRKKTSNPEI